MSAILQIAKQFEGKSEESLLSLSKDGTISIGTQTNSKETFESFQELIGENRLRRIVQRPEFGLSLHSLVLSKEVVRKIFTGLADLHKEDLDELNGPIEEKIRHLLPYKNMKEFEQLLMGKCPKVEDFEYDRPQTSGKGYQGLVERVFIANHHHFKVAKAKEKTTKMLRDVEMLTSRLADREIQPGTVVHLKNGYFFAEKIFVGGGAYAAIFRDIEGKKAPKIVCRGTAMRRTATGGLLSGMNDLQFEMGLMGVKAIWQELAKYLQDQQIRTIEVLGKSLGGAMAQQLTVLLEGVAGLYVKKLTTNASVGVGNEINSIFQREVLDKRTRPFKLCLVRAKGDPVPSVGGVHIGYGASPSQLDARLYSLLPKKEIKEAKGFFQFLHQFIDSLKPHCCQFTFNDFKWEKIPQSEVQQQLDRGTHYERYRRIFAYIAYPFLDKKSFRAFYNSIPNSIPG